MPAASPDALLVGLGSATLDQLRTIVRRAIESNYGSPDAAQSELGYCAKRTEEAMLGFEDAVVATIVGGALTYGTRDGGSRCGITLRTRLSPSA